MALIYTGRITFQHLPRELPYLEMSPDTPLDSESRETGVTLHHASEHRENQRIGGGQALQQPSKIRQLWRSSSRLQHQLERSKLFRVSTVVSPPSCQPRVWTSDLVRVAAACRCSRNTAVDTPKAQTWWDVSRFAWVSRLSACECAACVVLCVCPVCRVRHVVLLTWVR